MILCKLQTRWLILTITCILMFYCSYVFLIESPVHGKFLPLGLFQLFCCKFPQNTSHVVCWVVLCFSKCNITIWNRTNNLKERQQHKNIYITSRMKKITSIFGLHDQSKIYRYHEIRICDIDIVENSIKLDIILPRVLSRITC